MEKISPRILKLMIKDMKMAYECCGDAWLKGRIDMWRTYLEDWVEDNEEEKDK